MRATLMHNPGAGDEQPSGEALLGMLRAAGYDAAYQSTKKDNFAEALRDPGDLVVAAGGDGTVGKVAFHLIGRGIPLGVLPLGTANNIARTLGVAGSVEEIIGGWAGGRRKPFDVGTACGPWGQAHFIESVGAGLFTRTMSGVKSREEASGESHFASRQDELTRDLHVLMNILEGCPAQHGKVLLDGQEIAGRYLLLEAMNIQYVGPNLHLAPEADPGDGALDVVFLTADRRAGFVDYVTNRLEGGDPLPNVTVRRGRHLQIYWTGAALHIDDEVWPDETVHAWKSASPTHAAPVIIDVRLEKHALEFLLPG